MASEGTSLARLSMSLPSDLFRQLDAMVVERELPSRSQLIAELIRHALAEHEALTRPDEMLAGTITLVYRSDRGRVRHQLAQTQADYLKEVISSQHVFLEGDQSLEVLLVQGPATLLKELCDALRRVRGVQQLQLVTTTALLPPLYEQEESGRKENAA
ncbi:putative nickel-responsive regulator [Sphingobium herbicidovorans NBRC 16415]|jgi:CopG family transcriptional regulator, nickel-responsive regulator|uniref:Nickel-responsive regulator n=1 Tax=Sphingobium herbicidovorans (strain ATCC 700291 / DSM 11019 / CCUG 56400 / KCTC 2939 / LMG 18315 / NBRC 16415 / MH) TaxID=1219045 RepID=A0A086P757_SPHHM|nr:CopG family ribbon-helix-helix protein [Sphingobium herbicidovorans]KFG89225.1 putative nickel-responsive regulator [Sphingobium herbicidovorans NBRC 16415]